jgi:formylglycine-generating enzyme required for sulfatase activity
LRTGAPDIFISYAREDEAWVRPLATELERRGRSVFWDRRVPAGKDWRSHIGTALEQARCVVVIWSRHSIASKFVIEEADEGKEREVLFPVFRHPVRPPLGFRGIHAADLSDWSPGEAAPAFETFMHDIANVLGTIPVPIAELVGEAAAGSDAEILGGGSTGAMLPETVPTPIAAVPPIAPAPRALVPEPPTAPAASPQGETANRAVGAPVEPRPVVEAEGTGARTPGLGRVLTVSAVTVAVVAIAVGLYSYRSTQPERTTVAAVEEPLADAPPTPTSAKPAALAQPGQVFKDTLADGSPCLFCPAMVVIPVGSFTMGSPQSKEGRFDDEGPQRRVTFAQPFAIGQYEVTFAEWDACVAAGGCGGYRPDDEGWGRGQRPVIKASWEDAQAYAAWLAKQTGEPYRLPTEAEWEYAARAGTTTPFWTGATISAEQANYDGNYTYGAGRKGIYRERTVAVDDLVFPANPFGLYHVHGNVWEWVQDSHRDSYAGAPSDGSIVVEDPDSPGRVLRGGSWVNYPRDLRSAYRVRLAPDDRNVYVGFRVARALTP